MGGFFNPEKGVWSALSTMVDVCGLSILWLLLCLPVVTIGPATAALYFALVTCVRRQEPGAFGSYFRSFRENLRVGVPATLLCAAAALPLAAGFTVMRLHRGDQGGALLYGAYCVAMLLPVGTLCWLFPLLGRFTFGVRQLFVTAFQLTVRHLPSTAAVVLLALLAAPYCAVYWWPALFLPSVVMLIDSLFFERAFRRYAPELSGEEEPDEETGES